MSHYTPEHPAMQAQRASDMRKARAETLDMLTELSVLIDWLTQRGLDQSRQHMRAHEIIRLFAAGLGDGD